MILLQTVEHVEHYLVSMEKRYAPILEKEKQMPELEKEAISVLSILLGMNEKLPQPNNEVKKNLHHMHYGHFGILVNEPINETINLLVDKAVESGSWPHTVQIESKWRREAMHQGLSQFDLG